MAATGKVIGTVTAVVGEVKATAADGTVRILQVGDQVYSDEVINTSAIGSINIALDNGKTLDCGANTDLALHESILGVATAVSPATSAPGTPGSDVAALQAAISSGQDPSQVAPATAAGGAPAAGGAGGDGSGGTPVVIEQADSTSTITSGISTEGASITFPAPEFQLLPIEEQVQPPAVSVSVQVQVQVEVQVQIDAEGQSIITDGPAEGGVFAVSAGGDAVSLIEGTMEGTMEIPFVITLSQVFDTDVQVTYQIVPNSASYTTDFFDDTLDPVTITIPAGESSFIVPIQIVRDHFVEANESFSIVLIDAVNATINPAKASASVTIFNDDAPPVANPDTNWVQEDVINAAGNVLQDQTHAGAPSGAFADSADTDFEPLTVTTPGTFAGTYGTLVLNSDGGYVYTLNNGLPAVQALDTGETLTDSFNYSVTDGYNTPDSSTVTITIFGTNDAPVAHADTNWTQEDSESSTASGNVLQTLAHAGAPNGTFGDVADTDVDIENLTATLTSSATGTYGSLVLNSDGSYTYTLNNANAAVQALDAGETLTDQFTYTASDGTASAGATLTITIFGTNDGPTANADTNWAKEDTNVSIQGNVLQTVAHNGAPDEQSRGDVADSDVDADTLTASLVSSATGSFGSLVLNSDGSYTYTLNNGLPAVQGLDDGETLTDSFTYAASDGTDSTNATLTITIFGTNDAPTVAADTNWAKEDTNTTATGNVLQNVAHPGDPSVPLSFADVADSDVDVEPLSASLVSSATGSFGSLVLNSDGSYTYTLNNGLPAVQGLDDGETLTDAFTYAASDGTTSTNSTLTITIFGTNDAPTIDAQTTARVSEEGLAGANPDTTGSSDTTNAAVTGGTITVGDVDVEALTVTMSAPVEALTSKGTTILWALTDGGHTLTGTAGADTIVTITITDGGVYTVTLSGQIDHATVNVEDEKSFIVGLTVSDGTASAQGTLTVTVEDDSPVVSAATDLLYAGSSNPSPGGTGVFDYNIGADQRTSYDSTHSDFKPITLSGNVGGVAIVDPTVTWSSENSTTAVFDFTFDYLPNPADTGTTATATGSLTFDKVAGTYTVQLDAPIQSFSILSTSGQGVTFQGYDEGGSVQDNAGMAQVVVAGLSSNFFVQFSGDDGAPTAGGNGAFTNGEVLIGTAALTSASGSAIGVSSDTMQDGEVIDLDFFTSDPTGVTTTPPTAQASGIFLTFDGFGSEDLVVILKLVNLGADGVLGGGDDTFTTKAIIVDNADIFTNDVGNTPPAAYGLTLDNNDGAVIIESNDYNGVGENWLIQGAQINVSMTMTGTGINLNPTTGTLGGSTGFQEFEGTPGTANPEADTTDNDVLKISSMGFVTTTTSTANANLSFVGVSVVDADGDATPVQTLDVTVVGGTTYTGSIDDEVIQGSAANETMTGGGGNDIFDFNSMADAADTVTDFHIGNTASDANADVLDIGDILPGATQGATSAATLSGYVTLDTATSPGNTIVKVDADGGGDGYQTLVTLNGVTGVTLQQLLDNHQLVT